MLSRTGGSPLRARGGGARAGGPFRDPRAGGRPARRPHPGRGVPARRAGPHDGGTHGLARDGPRVRERPRRRGDAHPDAPVRNGDETGACRGGPGARPRRRSRVPGSRGKGPRRRGPARRAYGSGRGEAATADRAPPSEDRPGRGGGFPRRGDADGPGGDRAGRDALAALQERIDARVAEHSECVSRLSEIETALREARSRETELVERQAAERLRLQRFEMDIAGLDALLHQRYEIHLADLPPVEAADGKRPRRANFPFSSPAPRSSANGWLRWER